MPYLFLRVTQRSRPGVVAQPACDPRYRCPRHTSVWDVLVHRVLGYNGKETSDTARLFSLSALRARTRSCPGIRIDVLSSRVRNLVDERMIVGRRFATPQE